MVKVKNAPNAEKQINIIIILVKEQQNIAYESEEDFFNTDAIQYKYIKSKCDQFLFKHSIAFQTDIYTADPNHPGEIILTDPGFKADIQQLIFKMQGSLILIIKSALVKIKLEFQAKIQQLNQQIIQLKQTVAQLQKAPKENLQLMRKYSYSPVPALMPVHSQMQKKVIQNICIDIGILFSQPLFDEQKGKPTLPAVDFRTQISRVNIALQSSFKSNIVIRSQIGTSQSLKNIIKLSKPKILHIVCHGNSEGYLQFQDDSRNILGQLKYLKPQDVKNLLKNLIDFLPQLVFVNSCHSQSIGQSFYQLGVKHVISVNSSDPISDQAAMNFSENFYRKLFKGDTIQEAFSSKDDLTQIGICCCGHSPTLQPHRKNCRWLKLQQKYPNAHKDYHIPSSKCQCPKRNYNRHKPECQWARKVLFQINQDFRIPVVQDQKTPPTQFRFPRSIWQFPEYFDKSNKQLVICCCPPKDKKPHAQANKFKLLSKNDSQVLIHVKAQNKPPQIDDLTQASLLYAHQKSKAIFGRQKQLYQLLKSMKQINFMAIYGKSGVGLTTFSVKASTYMMERRIFSYFFFIDLYDIKDQTIFRYKFNQVTNFQYNGVTINEACLKDRTLLLFDNCDDFINKNPNQFYQQIQNLLKCIPKSKIIITFKQQTQKSFDQKKIFCKKFELSLFQTRYAVAFLNNKMKDKTDISVGCQQFRKLVNQYQVLKIPKVIQSLSQSFPVTSKGIKYEQIVKHVQGIKVSDTNKLTEQVLKSLQKQSRQAYEFLIFVSQFSDGISFEDIGMFSSYFRQNKSIKLPVKPNWQQHYLMLFEKQNNNQNQNISKKLINGDLLFPETTLVTSVSQPQHRTSNAFDSNRAVQLNQLQSKQKKNQKHNRFAKLDKIQSQSYFIDKTGQGRFIVKRFIRDFVWKKYQNQVTSFMKFLYVAYFSVILQMLFTILKQQRYIHEQLMSYSAISGSGIFSFSTKLQDNYKKRQDEEIDMTKSAKFAYQVLDGLQYIFKNNLELQKKMKQADFSTFILNHKHDFLKIYDNKWTDVYEHLKKKNGGQQKIFTIMLQNLMIYIPTAFKIANAEDQLLRYVINGSSKQLRKLSQLSRFDRNLILQLKLYMIQIGLNFDDSKALQKIIQNAQKCFYHPNSKNNQIYQIEQKKVHAIFEEQIFLLDLLQEQKKLKVQFTYQGLNHISEYINYYFQNKDNVQINALIKAKQGLVISMLFCKIISKKSFETQIFLKNNQYNQVQKHVLMISETCISIFRNLSCIKLMLKTKLNQIQIKLIVDDLSKKNDEQSYSNMYNQIIQYESIFMKFQNRLRGFTEFDDKIKQLKQKIKQNMWKTASKRMIFMKAYPLAAKNNPIIKNLIRKKNNFRQQIQRILTQKIKSISEYTSEKAITSPNPKSKQHKMNEQRKISLDLSTKYQILTKQKLSEQSKAKCSIMFITVDVRVKNNKQFFICQNQSMQQDLVQINYDLASQLNIDNVLILVLSGVNTNKALTKINQLCPNPPVIIALHSDPIQEHDQFDYSHDFDSDQILQLIKRQNQIKQAELVYTKYFIKKISQQSIQSKEAIEKIHEDSIKQMKKLTKCEKVKGFISIAKCKKDIHLQYKQGICRDLSPGYQRNHNIDHKSSENIILIRRWRKMIQFFKCLRNFKVKNLTGQNQNPNNTLQVNYSYKQKNTKKQNSKASYINIYGENGCGKTFFIKQIAKILVQRQFYDFGVFLFDGKMIQKQFHGDFEAYIKKQASENRMPVYEDFEKLLGPKTILIVDDFHLIKPRMNARMKLFMDKIISKSVNLILVSVNELKLQLLQNMKKIKIQPLETLETEVYAYNYINVFSPEQIKMYTKLKQQKKKENKLLTIKQIQKLFQRFKNSKNSSMGNSVIQTADEDHHIPLMSKRFTTFD